MYATRKSQMPNSRAPLQEIQAGYPMQIVAVDIMGPSQKPAVEIGK